MKLYTFTNSNDEIIEEVRANNHDDAIAKASNLVTYSTDFYSETLHELVADHYDYFAAYLHSFADPGDNNDPR